MNARVPSGDDQAGAGAAPAASLPGSHTTPTTGLPGSHTAPAHPGHHHGPSAADAARDATVRHRLAIAFCLVFAIVIVQVIGAAITGSLALAVDVMHSFTDSLGLLVALGTAILMSRPAGKNSTWGLRRLEVLSALLQSVLLAGMGVYALVSALRRWFHPPEMEGGQLIIFGLIALALNLAAAAVLLGRRSANFNIRAAFLEVAMDALGTLAVIGSGVVVELTGFDRADPIAAVVIAMLIIPRALKLARDTVRVLMEFTPEGLDLDEVRRHILQQDHVLGVHDLHASTIGTGMHTISAHVIVDPECFSGGYATRTLRELRECVAGHFPVSITHSTFQLEPGDSLVDDE